MDVALPCARWRTTQHSSSSSRFLSTCVGRMSYFKTEISSPSPTVQRTHAHTRYTRTCTYIACTCACDMCMCMCMCMCMWKCSLYDRTRVYCVGSAVIILNDRIQRDGERTVTQSPDSHLSASVFSYRSLLTFTLLPKSMSPTSRRPSSRRTKVYPSLSYSAIAGSSPSSTWVAEIQRRYRGDTWEMQGRYRAVASRPQA